MPLCVSGVKDKLITRMSLKEKRNKKRGCDRGVCVCLSGGTKLGRWLSVSGVEDLMTIRIPISKRVLLRHESVGVSGVEDLIDAPDPEAVAAAEGEREGRYLPLPLWPDAVIMVDDPTSLEVRIGLG
jgi:hypothetical protein